MSPAVGTYLNNDQQYQSRSPNMLACHIGVIFNHPEKVRNSST